ncbi:YbjQ family protein [Alkalihalobacillus oceani]|uniref:YbjQ family protein n=1 Tax=Halalkalibacter oceani TaxID=1653776 RepID=UPI00203D862E|nr:YbjQ family protein [Halalkalibacter oceani]MCM3760876.1 YbjQ family protein [Halalkalibacter oceani]
MIMTTTTIVEGRPVSSYLGIVTSEIILGANVVRDFFASITDIVGGRSGAYESKLQEGREEALRELESKARRMGADAVVGIDLDFETLRDGMMMIVATGTAVKLS